MCQNFTTITKNKISLTLLAFRHFPLIIWHQVTFKHRKNKRTVEIEHGKFRKLLSFSPKSSNAHCTFQVGDVTPIRFLRYRIYVSYPCYTMYIFYDSINMTCLIMYLKHTNLKHTLFSLLFEDRFAIVLLPTVVTPYLLLKFF